MKAPRNTIVDVARGFTVFIMPGVHSVLYYGNRKTHRSWLGKLLGFLAEGPGAQLFMFLMGTSIALGRKRRTRPIMAKATRLMAQGLLLNILRLIIPFKLGFFPEDMLQEAGLYSKEHRLRKMLLTGDILQCAAICYPITALIYRSKKPFLPALLSAASVIFFSQKAWDKPRGTFPGAYLLKLCTGKPPAVFFPVFPWLSYALTGLAWGILLRQQSVTKLYPFTALAGIILIASGKLLSKYESLPLRDDFYRLGPGGTLSHLGIVLLWLYLSKVVVKRLPWNRFLRLLVRLSKNITRIYILQWIVVLWLLPFFGYRKSGLIKSTASMILNTIITIHLTKSKTLCYAKNIRCSRDRNRSL